MKANTKKVADFFKRNAYYIVMAVCVLAIITMVTLALVLTFTEEEPPTVDANGSLVTDAVENEPTVDSTPDLPTIDTPVIDDSPIVDTPVVDNKPVDNKPVDKPVEDTDNNTEELPETGEKEDEIKPSFTLPLDSYTTVKGYSATPVYNSTLKRYVAHKAVDLTSSRGASVKAIADGSVETVTYDILYGHQVTILHADGVRSVYKSLDNLTVKAGDKVTVGQVIATISTSAGSEAADGEHLHFEIIVNEENVDPIAFLNDKLK